MAKGISTVIATLLMLIITIALVGFSYSFINSFLSSKTSDTFSIVDTFKDSVTIRNDGTGIMSSMRATLGGSPVNTIFDLKSNLVGYWRFNEGTGTTAKDSSGKGNDGTLTNGPQWVDGKFGKALSYDGIDDNITVADSPTLRLGTQQTVSLWYKWNGGGSNDWRRLVGKGIFTERNYGLWVFPTGNPQAKMELFQIWASGATSGTGQCNPIILNQPRDTNWHHLVGTYDGSISKLYVDGRLVNEKTCSITPANSADPLTIGSAGFHSPFDGLIDEVQIYNKAFTQKEVEALYAADGELILEPGQMVTIKLITSTPLTSGSRTLRLCSQSMCTPVILSTT